MNAASLERAERSPLFAWGAFVPLVLALALGALASRRDWGPQAVDVPWFGAAVLFCALLPGLVYKATRQSAPQRSGLVPFFPTIGVLYGLYFGFPVLHADEFLMPTLQGTQHSLARAIELALWGWIALLAGWTLGGKVWSRVRPLDLPLDEKRTDHALPWLLGLGAAGIFVHRTLPVPGGLAQPLRYVQMLFQLGLGILVLRSLRGALEPRLKQLTWGGLVPAYIFLQIGDGSVAQLAYASLYLFFLVWGAGKRVPLLALGVAALFMMLLRGNVHAFRDQAWTGASNQSEQGVFARSVLFFEILYERFSEEPVVAIEESFEEVSTRVAHLGTFSHVAQLTPARVPYWEGETYAALPSSIVPRIFWPNKPSKQIGQDFGHRYELLAPSDKTTAVNLPQLIEFYANFGPRGVLWGMLAMGLLYRFLHRWWNMPGVGEGTLVLAAVYFSRLILIESDFTLTYGAVIQFVVLLVLTLRALGPKRERRAPPKPAELVGGLA